MKKFGFMALGLVVALATYNCKDAKKENKQAEEAAPTYSIVEDSTSIAFTAYKTTEKKPVGGKFTKVTLDYTPGATAAETMDGLSFSIPVSSLFTNDATGTRDPKILQFFFGMMADTEMIKGTFSVGEDNSCSVSLTLNGVTETLPMEMSMPDSSHVHVTGTLDLAKWNALDALASLNKACEALHTGPDGVSKTWEDVAIEGTVLLNQN